MGFDEPSRFHQDLVGPLGELLVRHRDISIPAPGWPLELRRTYRSGWSGSVGLGQGWSWTYGIRITAEPETGLPWTVEEDGRITRYRGGPRNFLPVDDPGHSLFPQDDGGYLRVYADGGTERFDPSGWIVERQGPRGTTQRIERRGATVLSVQDSVGRGLKFEESSGRLTVTDPIGRRIIYRIVQDRLVEVTDPLGRETRYSYGGGAQFEKMILADRSEVTVEWDPAGRVARLRGPGSLETRFEHRHAFDGRSTERVTILGNGQREKLLVRHHDEGLSASIERDGGAPLRFVSHQGSMIPDPDSQPPTGWTLPDLDSPAPAPGGTDAKGQPTSLEGSGVRLKTAFDDGGRLTRVSRDGLPAETLSYDAADRLIGIQGPEGGNTVLEYDLADRLIAFTDTRGRRIEQTHDGRGLIEETREPEGLVTRFEHDAGGRLIALSESTKEDPGVETRFEFDGRRIGVHEAPGRLTEITLDARGHVENIIPPEGKPWKVEQGVLKLPGGETIRQVPGRSEWTSAMGRKTSCTFTPDGRPLVLSRPGQEGWLWQYDTAGALTAQGTAGALVRYLRDDAGRLVREEHPHGEKIEYQHDDRGKVVRRVSSAGYAVQYEYDSSGDLIAESDSRTGRTAFVHDAKGRLTEEQRGGQVLRLTYDARDRIVALEDGSVKEVWTHDPSGNLTEIHRTEGSRTLITRFSYDSHGRLARMEHPEGGVETYERDAEGRTVRHVDRGIETTWTYDESGWVARRGESQVTCVLDADGRMTGSTGASPWKVAYGVSDLPVKWTSGRGASWLRSLDSRERTATTTDPLGQSIQFTYAPTGGLVEVAHSAGPRHVFQRDEHDRAIAWGMAGAFLSRFRYEAGRLVSWMPMEGQEIGWTYTAEGKIETLRVDASPRYRYEYDPTGRLIAVEDPNLGGKSAYEYDEGDRIVKETDAFGLSLTHEYDSVGRRVKTTFPGGKSLQYRYGSDGRLISQIGFDGGTSSLTYDTVGRVAGIILPGDGKVEIGHHPSGAIEKLSYRRAGTVLVERSLEYEPDGLTVKSVAEGDRRWIYTHDELDRLVSTRYPDGSTETAAFDVLGGPVRLGSKRLPVDGGLRLEGATHDDAGRLTGWDGQRLEYDALGRVQRFHPAVGEPIDLRYDHHDRLVERRQAGEITRYVYLEGRLAGAYDVQGRPRALLEHVPGPLKIVRSVTSSRVDLALVDDQGTPIGILAADGSLSRHEHGSWGEARGPRSSIEDLVGYTGAPTVGPLVLLGPRAYIPSLGRFAQPDPLGIEGGFHPYSYADGSPRSKADDSGLKPDPNAKLSVERAQASFERFVASSRRQGQFAQGQVISGTGSAPRYQAPFSRYIQTGNGGSVKQVTVYGSTGRSFFHVDPKPEAGVGPYHGHIFTGKNINAGHGKGAWHIPPELVGKHMPFLEKDLARLGLDPKSTLPQNFLRPGVKGRIGALAGRAWGNLSALGRSMGGWLGRAAGRGLGGLGRLGGPAFIGLQLLDQFRSAQSLFRGEIGVGEFLTGFYVSGMLAAAVAITPGLGWYFTAAWLAYMFWDWFFHADPTYVANPVPPDGTRDGPHILGSRFEVPVWFEEAGEVRTLVKSEDGKIVRDLGLTRCERGCLRLGWDGLDADGSPVGEGEYELVVEDGRSTASMAPRVRERVRVDRTPPGVTEVNVGKASPGTFELSCLLDEPARVEWSLRLPNDTWRLLRVPSREPSGRVAVSLDASELPTGVSVLRVVAIDPAGLRTESLLETTNGESKERLVHSVDIQRTIELLPRPDHWGSPDQMPPWIDGALPDKGEAIGHWKWVEKENPMGSPRLHESDGDHETHYVLAPSAGWFLPIDGHLVQYVYLDPGHPPHELRIQLYGPGLDGEHRVHWGRTTGSAARFQGFMPRVGTWIRLKVKSTSFGLAGRKVEGVLFSSPGGKVLWGPTTTSEADDPAPPVAVLEGAPLSTDPVARLGVRFQALHPEVLRLVLQGAGTPVTLIEEEVQPGVREVTWSGPPADLDKFKELVFSRPGPRAIEERIPLVLQAPADGLVAHLMFPADGAVVSETVPLFGEAGGTGFREYRVEYRQADGESDPWVEVVHSRRSTALREDEIRHKFREAGRRYFRRTVKGNLGSLDIASTQNFPYHVPGKVLRPGTLLVRLRVIGDGGVERIDQIKLHVGQVIENSCASVFESRDGKVRVSLPPFALSPPSGLALLAIEGPLLDLTPPPGTLLSGIYRLQPGGVRFSRPARLAFKHSSTPTGARVQANVGGREWAPLPPVDGGPDLVCGYVMEVTHDTFFALVEAPGKAAAAPEPTPAMTPGLPASVSVRPEPPDAEGRSEPVWQTSFEEQGEVVPDAFSGKRVRRFSSRPAAETLLGTPFEPPRAPELSFVYRLRPGSTVHLMLLGEGHPVLVELHGTPIGRVRRAHVVRGPTLVADGKWHGIALDLTRLVPPDVTRIDEIRIGRVRQVALHDCHLSGLDDSSALDLDCLWLGRSWTGTRAVELVYPPGATGPLRWGIGAPDQTLPDLPGRLVLPTLPDGLAVLALEAGKDPLVRWPLLIDVKAPVVVETLPRETSSADRVRIRLSEEGSGVDTASLAIRIQGQALSRDSIRFDGETGWIEASLGALAIAPGTVVKVVLEPVADRAGNRMEGPLEWSWTYQPTLFGPDDLRVLTDRGGWDGCWSPEGKSVIFVSDHEGAPDLYELEIVTGVLVRLTRDAAVESSPGCAPDGSRVVFHRSGAIWLLDRTTSRESKLVDELVDPGWCGLDTLLAAGPGGVMEVSLTGGLPRLLFAGRPGGEIRRPRGTRNLVAYHETHYVDSAWYWNGNRHALSPEPEDPAVSEREAAPSPDGEWLVHVDAGLEPGLWLSRTSKDERVLLLRGASGDDRRPSWRPDGGALLFDAERGGRRSLWRLELARLPAVRVNPDPWSPSLGTPLTMGMSLDQPAEVEAAIETARGEPVHPLRSMSPVAAGPLDLSWSGEGARGGPYVLKLSMRAQGRLLTGQQPLPVDDRPPRTRAYRTSDGREVGPLTEPAFEDRIVLSADDGPGGSGDRKSVV